MGLLFPGIITYITYKMIPDCWVEWMTPGNNLYILSSHRASELFSLSLCGDEPFIKPTLHSQQRFFDLPFFSLQLLPPLSFPLEQNSERVRHTRSHQCLSSQFFLNPLLWGFYPYRSIKTASSRPSTNFLLNPVVNCQSSTNVTIRSIWHSWSFLPSLKHFLHLASRKPHCWFWVIFFSYLLGLSFSFFFAGSSPSPWLLTMRMPRILVKLLVSIYTYDLGDVIQAQSFKYYPYANDSKITAQP